MSQERLSNDDFLTRLSHLFTSTHTASHGSVYLTQKPLADAQPQILIRATNGLSKAHRTPKTKSTKIRLATVVDTAEIDGFYMRYAEVCKKGMEALRKRDKKKAKVKAKAKKKGKSAS
ncbi:hypothetical protein LTS15_008753 [Exophiala xenobiotica]|nr:hypothetical protein LTS15_008753 [Exophiala xenobiotica]